MSSVSVSMKKLRQKENFKVKMGELLNLDADCNVALGNDINCTIVSNLDEKTSPNKVYDFSKDIVFQAFNSEVLTDAKPT